MAPTFADRLSATRDVLAKSNQDNLAHAYLYLEEAEKKAQDWLRKLAALRAEIEAAGDTDTVLQDASGVATKDLYDRAMREARYAR